MTILIRHNGLLSHLDPNIDLYIVVMKYTEQGSLHDFLVNNSGKLSWARKQTIACQIAEALDYIHDANITHQNLHSGNIL